MPKQLVCPDSGKRMTNSRRVITVCCPACGQYIRLRKDGRLMRHRAPTDAHNARLRQTAEAIDNWKKGRL